MNKYEIIERLTEYEKAKEFDKLKFYKPFTIEQTETNPPTCQEDFHKDHHKKRWLFSGNRSGKTVAGAAEAVLYALGRDGEPYWDGMPAEAVEKYKSIRTPNEGWVVASDHNVQVEASQKWIMKLLPGDMIAENGINRKRNQILDSITLKNGSVIGFKSSASGAKSFEGASKRWIWFDEEPQYESVYNECLMRESGTYPLDFWGTMTPVKGITFTYDRIFKKRDEDEDLAVFRWATMDNPYLDDEIVERFKREYKNEPKELRRRLYGKFTGKSGLVYPMFRREKHVVEPFVIDKDWTIYEGIDIGFANPSAVVWVAVAPDGTKYIINELYRKGLTMEELGKIILEKRREGEFYAGPMYRPLLSLIDPAAQRRPQPIDKRDFNQKQIVTPRKKLKSVGIHTRLADNAVFQGLENVRSELRDREETEKPNLFVFNNCRNWIEEIENYRLKSYESESTRERKSQPEKPRKKDDHLMDATRYVISEGVRHVGRNSMVGTTGKPGTDSSGVTGY